MPAPVTGAGHNGATAPAASGGRPPDAIVLLRNDHKVTVLIESVRHHVEEEETEMFPQVREALADAQGR